MLPALEVPQTVPRLAVYWIRMPCQGNETSLVPLDASGFPTVAVMTCVDYRSLDRETSTFTDRFAKSGFDLALTDNVM